MVSSSAGDYEVFLSFRGADTRQGFTDVLYDYMDSANIRVFRDDDALRIGDKIDSILEFIVNSKICIPIFSPNFVQSKYCMLEVSKMVELKKTIIPIFYNVTSDDVKLKTSLYVDDLQKLEEKYGKHQVDKWKQALKEAVSYKGRKVGVKGYSQFCKEFVVEILSKLRSSDLDSSSSSSSHQEASVSVGIDGLGGRIATLGGPVMVLSQEFVASYPVDLIFQKSGSIDFVVTDSNDTIIFNLKNHYFINELLDASGKTLLTMQQKPYHLSLDVRAFRGKSTHKEDFMFKMKFPKPQFKTNAIYKYSVYLAQNTNKDVWDYRVDRYCSENKCVIYAGTTNNMIAQIMPNEGTVQSAMTGKNHFVVTVYSHIDYAFIVALIASAECAGTFL